MSDIWQSSEESDDLNPRLESRKAESSLYTDGFQEGIERGMAISIQSGYNTGYFDAINECISWGNLYGEVESLKAISYKIKDKNIIDKINEMDDLTKRLSDNLFRCIYNRLIDKARSCDHILTDEQISMLVETNNMHMNNEEIPEASVKFSELKMLLNSIKELLGII